MRDSDPLGRRRRGEEAADDCERAARASGLEEGDRDEEGRGSGGGEEAKGSDGGESPVEGV